MKNFVSTKQRVLKAPRADFGHVRQCGINRNGVRRLCKPCVSGSTESRLTKLKELVVMTAIVQTLFRTFHSVSDIDVLREIALLCGAGLLVSLLALTYGLDLSPGFF